MPKGFYRDDVPVDPCWGNYLRLRRKREFRTQHQAAAIIGISPRTLEAFERGRRLYIRSAVKPTFYLKERSMPESSDPIHPSYYQSDYVMRVIEDFNLDFLSGTIIKYLLWAGRKPGEPALQDLKKAAWYLQRKIDNLEKEARNG